MDLGSEIKYNIIAKSCERWEETHYGHRLLTIRIYDIIGTIIDRLIVDARPIFLQFQDVI